MKKISQYSPSLGRFFRRGERRRRPSPTNSPSPGSTSATASFFLDGRKQTSSQTAANNVDTQSSEPQPGSKLIASLLDDDDFLSSILAALVDDGLHECRRVCRRWRDACDALPLKFALIDKREVQRITEKFPNASDVSVTASLPVNSFSRPPPLSSLRDQFLGTWFDSLTRLPRLRRLSIKTIHFTDFLCDDQEPLFLPLVQLRSLSIRSLDDHHIDVFFFAVRVLTNLTSLQLFTDDRSIQSINATPVTELQRLKELEIAEDLSCNEAGRFMFPGAAQLTHLGFWHPPREWLSKDTIRPVILARVRCPLSLSHLVLY